MKVTKRDLNESIAKVMANIICEEFDTSDWDAQLDSIMKDPSFKKAGKVAKKQIEDEDDFNNAQDAAAEKGEFLNSNENGDEEDDENEEGGGNADNTVSKNQGRELIYNFAKNETDPDFLRALNAGVDPMELYSTNVWSGEVYRRKISEPDFEYMIKHPRFGKSRDVAHRNNPNFLDDFDFKFGHWGGHTVTNAETDAEGCLYNNY